MISRGIIGVPPSVSWGTVRASRCARADGKVTHCRTRREAISCFAASRAISPAGSRQPDVPRHLLRDDRRRVLREEQTFLDLLLHGLAHPGHAFRLRTVALFHRAVAGDIRAVITTCRSEARGNRARTCAAERGGM